MSRFLVGLLLGGLICLGCGSDDVSKPSTSSRTKILPSPMSFRPFRYIHLRIAQGNELNGLEKLKKKDIGADGVTVYELSDRRILEVTKVPSRPDVGHVYDSIDDYYQFAYQMKYYQKCSTTMSEGLAVNLESKSKVGACVKELSKEIGVPVKLLDFSRNSLKQVMVGLKKSNFIDIPTVNYEPALIAYCGETLRLAVNGKFVKVGGNNMLELLLQTPAGHRLNFAAVISKSIEDSGEYQSVPDLYRMCEDAVNGKELESAY